MVCRLSVAVGLSPRDAVTVRAVARASWSVVVLSLSSSVVMALPGVSCRDGESPQKLRGLALARDARRLAMVTRCARCSLPALPRSAAT